MQETAPAPQVNQLSEELRAEQETNLILTEQIADLELALEDKGWRRLGAGGTEFTAEGRRTIASICRSLAVSHPLIKRALTVRIGYVWGQGVEIRGRAGEDDAQDVNGVVQAFLDDNVASLSGSQAQEELERALGTDGNIYLAAFTSPLTGRVQVRSTPADEILDIVTNPDDRDEPWFYVREHTQTDYVQGLFPGNTRTASRTVKTYHPALGYRPVTRAKMIDGAEVRWDAPILHVPVNRLDGWKYGIPDVYAAAAWARMYRDFLVDWAGLTKALSKIAWKMTGDTRSRAVKAAAAARQSAAFVPDRPGGDAGQAAALGPGQNLEAVSKSGATIDANSGKPLAGMVAAGVGLPVTMLLADPGVTGARAVAETLDLPTILEMGMRRLLWQGKLTELINYVIDQAVLAPRGRLRGSLVRDDWDRLVVTLAGDVDRTVEFDWPALVDVDPVELVKAIVAAEGSNVGGAVPLVMLRLLLSALGVEDIDEVIADATDDQGRLIDQQMTAGQAAVDAFNRGEDPAEAVR
ncbi:MAG: hypothetical protein HOV66_29230 [Streptomycetaceae bacterium]|nr:hypothetical protein [Streptomycetaceae bacterium]